MSEWVIFDGFSGSRRLATLSEIESPDGHIARIRLSSRNPKALKNTLRQNANLSRRFNLIWSVQIENEKYFSFRKSEVVHIFAPSRSVQRAYRDRHETWNGMRWTRRRRLTSGDLRGWRSCVVLAPLGWCQVRDDAYGVARATVTKRSWTPGRAQNKP
jgi:hypothetical protein